MIYKMAYYSFYLPVALSIYMTGIPHTTQNDPYVLAQSILIPLGEYFQVQDDFLNFAQPPQLLGKIGTDIVDNKCSWCVNTTLAPTNSVQRKVLDGNYGRKDGSCSGARCSRSSSTRFTSARRERRVGRVAPARMRISCVCRCMVTILEQARGLWQQSTLWLRRRKIEWGTAGLPASRVCLPGRRSRRSAPKSCTGMAWSLAVHVEAAELARSASESQN